MASRQSHLDNTHTRRLTVGLVSLVVGLAMVVWAVCAPLPNDSGPPEWRLKEPDRGGAIGLAARGDDTPDVAMLDAGRIAFTAAPWQATGMLERATPSSDDRARNQR